MGKATCRHRYPASGRENDAVVSDSDRYNPIGDYALIGDCHTSALVSREGSIDWCCLPRFDAGSAFGRLLDFDRGGFCAVTPSGGEPWESSRDYLEDALVLETRFKRSEGEVALFDLFLVRDDQPSSDARELLRVIEGRRGTFELDVRIAPRFDYGEVRPLIRRHGLRLHSAIGGNDGLVIFSEAELTEDPEHELAGRVRVSAGERVHLLMRYTPPELVDPDESEPEPDALDRRLEATLQWWRRWADTVRLDSRDEPGARRSALVLKAMTHEPTGAIVAAPTTSLPEAIGGERNWDYRYAWVRDSSFSSSAFAEVGCTHEADAFRAFIMRSAAGYAGDLQIVYGVGGERRMPQLELDDLEGWRGSRPVHVGNGAAGQLQLDAYGELINLAWRWHRRGHSPSDDDWRFLASLIDHAAEQWDKPDSGIWEWPGSPQHFVHSKVMCWAALERGIRLADECLRRAPTRRWKQARDAVREAIEDRGYDAGRGVFVQVFDRPELDAALLLLPSVEFVDWSDERMVRTADAVREELDAGHGLLYRYRRDDGLSGTEGAFLCCSFWLVECLARQGRIPDARAVYESAVSAGNELGLFSEEVDPETRELLGNFPQGLTHLAHIAAAVCLADVERS
jgi:GH15 family glucan-1,4-alpha-glucosidase